MQFSVWNAMATIGIAVLTTVATVWAERRVFGPRLSVIFRHDEYGTTFTTEHHRQTAEMVSLARPGEEAGQLHRMTLTHYKKDVAFIRLRVQNVGRGVARGCRGFLVDFEREEQPGKFKRFFFDAIPLCWSYLDATAPQVIDLPSGVDINLDVISTERDCPSFTPRLESMPFRYEGQFTAPALYRLSVAVVAENTDPQLRQLYFHWNGQWNGFRVDTHPIL